MNTVTPFLWFEKDMASLVAYYQKLFPGTLYWSTGIMEGTPSGTVEYGVLTIYGVEMQVMTAGPYLPFTYTVSFLISCSSEEEARELFEAASSGGSVLMPFGAYPFAESFGWCADAYGVNWQFIYAPDKDYGTKLTPVLMFTDGMQSDASTFAEFYTELLSGNVRYVDHYMPGESEISEAKVKHEGLTLGGLDIAVMDSGRHSLQDFKQAISLVITCDTQHEVDRIWGSMVAAGGTPVQCGWITDASGFPWQVTPKGMEIYLQSSDKEASARAQSAMMNMVKLDIEEIKKAYSKN